MFIQHVYKDCEISDNRFLSKCVDRHENHQTLIDMNVRSHTLYDCTLHLSKHVSVIVSTNKTDSGADIDR